MRKVVVIGAVIYSLLWLCSRTKNKGITGVSNPIPPSSEKWAGFDRIYNTLFDQKAYWNARYH